jgi:hypothetical protein
VTPKKQSSPPNSLVSPPMTPFSQFQDEELEFDIGPTALYTADDTEEWLDRNHVAFQQTLKRRNSQDFIGFGRKAMAYYVVLRGLKTGIFYDFWYSSLHSYFSYIDCLLGPRLRRYARIYRTGRRGFGAKPPQKIMLFFFMGGPLRTTK